jgi:hypothetical protein
MPSFSGSIISNDFREKDSNMNLSQQTQMTTPNEKCSVFIISRKSIEVFFPAILFPTKSVLFRDQLYVFLGLSLFWFRI